MTSFAELWASLASKRPLLNDDAAKVEIRVDNFRELLRQFYDKGKASQAASQTLNDKLFGGR